MDKYDLFLYFTEHDVPALKTIRLIFHSYTHTYQTQYYYISRRLGIPILKPNLSCCFIEIYEIHVAV